MPSSKLITIFQSIRTNYNLPEQLDLICDTIINHSEPLKPISIDYILQNKGIEITKVGLMNLLMTYIELCLEDNILTIEEKDNVEYLKKVFKISEGDLYMHYRIGITEIVRYQLQRIYRDNLVTDEEALFKVDLQKLFDLGYDEMNEISTDEVIRAIEEGANINDLDCVFSPKDYFQDYSIS